MVAGHFKQVGAHRGEAVMACNSRIGVERSEQFQTPERAMHGGCGNGVIQDHHGIVGNAFQDFVERQDLRPIGIPGSGRFVVNGCDGSL